MLPYIGPIAFDNVSGDMPVSSFEISDFTIPGVHGTGTVIEGRRYADQWFHCMMFCTNDSVVNLLKAMLEAVQLSVVEMQTSMGEYYQYCLVLPFSIPSDATIGIEAVDVPNGDGTFRPYCTRKVDVNIPIRFLFNVFQ